MNYPYARRVSLLKSSDIRELLKVTENRDVISFGGGLPAPELFPLEEIKAISALVLEEEGFEALQYSTTEGYGPLRQWIADRMNKTQGTAFEKDDILITNGSQQALDLTGKVFLDEGDVVLCESPTYLAAISAFKAYCCAFEEIPTDEEGMIPEALDTALANTPKAKLIYVVPNFQNPSGRTWSLLRRKMLYEIAAKYQVVIIEDNPYGELRFEGEDILSIKSFDETGSVLCLGTFSKTFCPGYRIGWVAGERQVIEKYVQAKQGADLQCNTLSQREIARYLEVYDIDKHIAKIKETYRHRRNLAIRTMEEFFPAGVRFTRPQGGLFLWVELPDHVNARDVLVESMKQDVVFVPGGSFFPNGGNENTMRINFSNMPDDRLVSGLRILGKVLSASI